MGVRHKVIWVRMQEALRWSGEMGRVVVSKHDKHWHVSVSVHIDCSNYTQQTTLFDDREPVGVDVGINTLATCSDGVIYTNPRPLQRFERKLARANRRRSRREKGSKNWYKAKDMVSGVHARIANIRNDAHHKATTDIVRRASAIGVETLMVSNLLKNRNIAKAHSDAALGGFLVKLTYKAKRRGVPIVKADRFFASRKTCSQCGHKKKDLTLSDRIYHCDACGVSIDRDLNAAINLCPS